MAKTFFLALALTIIGSAAQAQTTPAEAHASPAAARSQDYWLSNGLNRLVFWKTPMQSGRSVATEPSKH